MELPSGNCLITSVIYRAKVKDKDENIQTYTGLTAGTFKKRFYSHRNSFNNRNSEHSTTLSSHVWSLQDKQENFKINWKVIDRAKKFNPINRRCGLCTKEKYYIIFQPEGASLNEQKELFSTCRHRLENLLANTWVCFSFQYRTFPLTKNLCHFQLSLKIVVQHHMKQFVRPMKNKLCDL